MIARIRVDERLVLELLGPQHVDAGTALIDRSRAELIPWMPWAEGSDEAAYREFVARVEVGRRGGSRAGGAAYALLVDEAFAGCIDFHDEIPAERSAQIGYWLGTPYLGRGWMTKSVTALAALGFTNLGLHRIKIVADVENVHSRRVAERAGFALTAIRRRWLDGRERDEAIYERLAPE